MAETYSVDNGTVALAAATAKTVIELSSGATVASRVIEFWVGSDYLTLATPISFKVEFITFGTTGTGTAYTPKKNNGESQGRAATSTAKINDTVEPTTSVTVIKTVPPIIIPAGPLMLQWPLGREGVYVPASTNIGLRITASAICNAFAHLIFEE